jgi:hypothetical protein
MGRGHGSPKVSTLIAIQNPLGSQYKTSSIVGTEVSHEGAWEKKAILLLQIFLFEKSHEMWLHKEQGYKA